MFTITKTTSTTTTTITTSKNKPVVLCMYNIIFPCFFAFNESQLFHSFFLFSNLGIERARAFKKYLLHCVCMLVDGCMHTKRFYSFWARWELSMLLHQHVPRIITTLLFAYNLLFRECVCIALHACMHTYHITAWKTRSRCERERNGSWDKGIPLSDTWISKKVHHHQKCTLNLCS